MDNPRVFLYAALAFILFMIWQAWEQQHAPTQAPVAGSQPVEPGAPTHPDPAGAEAVWTASLLPKMSVSELSA